MCTRGQGSTHYWSLTHQIPKPKNGRQIKMPQESNCLTWRMGPLPGGSITPGNCDPDFSRLIMNFWLVTEMTGRFPSGTFLQSPGAVEFRARHCREGPF